MIDSGPLEVTVTVPAELTTLPVLRSIAATLGTARDFDIDTIADLRMAVDEMASSVITRARPRALVRVDFRADGDRVTVVATVAANDGAAVDESSFGWTVLSALTAELGTEVTTASNGDGPQLTMRFSVVAARGGS